MEEIQKNPARFFGEHAIEIAGAAATAMGEAAAIPRAVEAAGEAGAAGKMGQVAKGMEGAAAGRKALGEGAQTAGGAAREGNAAGGMRTQQQQMQAQRVRENKERLRQERSGGSSPQRPQSPKQGQPQEPAKTLEIPSEIEGVEGWPKSGGAGQGQAAGGPLVAQERARLRDAQIRQSRDARDLEEAGRTLKGMVDDSREFSGFGANGAAGPDFSKIFAPSSEAKGPVNIAKAIDRNAGNQNCFPVALAAAKRWKTGRPAVALDHNPHVPLYDPSLNKFVYDDVPTPGYAVTRVLKKEFGSGKAKDPFHDGARGLGDHQEGIPVPSSQTKIQHALLRAGDGSQGLVFVDGGPGTPHHVFNVRNSGGKIEFWDFQADPPVQYLRFGSGDVTMNANGITASSPLGWSRIFFYRLD